MITLFLAAALTNIPVSQSEFENQARMCGIEPSPVAKEPYWRAKRSDDGLTIQVMLYEGMAPAFECMTTWGRLRGVTVIGVRH